MTLMYVSRKSMYLRNIALTAADMNIEQMVDYEYYVGVDARVYFRR